MGVLVIEDLVAILLLVLLSTVAVSQQFSGGELIYAIGKLGGFLIAVFVVGIYLIPTMLQRNRKLMNAETLLIVSIALCLGMVYLATMAGFSAALGAFIMGSLLAETVLAERIEHLVKPVKHVDRSRDTDRSLETGAPPFFCGGDRTTPQQHDRCVDRGPATETFRASRNEPLADRRIFVHHCHTGTFAGCDQLLPLPHRRGRFRRYNVLHALHDQGFGRNSNSIETRVARPVRCRSGSLQQAG